MAILRCVDRLKVILGHKAQEQFVAEENRYANFLIIGKSLIKGEMVS
jgi:hypothetical protein